MKRLLRYGVEAPYVPLWMTLVALICLVLTVAAHSWFWLIPFVVFAAETGIFLHTTLVGKHRVWADELDALHLHGDERVLDIGCGRGAVLVAAARRLPRGTAEGIDLWRSQDQSGNTEEAARANAVADGVADRIRLHTGDMTELPFDDASFDVVASALAVHNLKTPAQRQRAVEEAARVLRPGGRLLLVDFRHSRQYADWLRPLLEDVAHRGLGWRYWYGGPWTAASIVSGHRPGSAPGEPVTHP